MKYLQNIFIGFTIFFSSVQATLAKCTLNGKEIPCSEIPIWIWPISFLFIGLGIFCFVFWLRMLIDAIKHQTENKTMWVLLITFLNILGALIYYFLVKRERNKLST